MDLEQVERALHSLQGWTKGVGCMGGEPTLHPEFERICGLYQKYVGRARAGLWTSGGPKFKEYRSLILQTFARILYNDHSEVGKHQPIFVASNEIIPDRALRDELIDHCWIQDKWSPAINQKGAFFCEIAAVFDLLFDGPGGFPLEPGWWRKTPDAFLLQRERYCGLCSIPVPLPPVSNNQGWDYVSPENMERLLKAGSPWAEKGKIKVINDQFSRSDILNTLKEYEYTPWQYLGEKEVRDKTGAFKGGYAKRRQHKVLDSPDIGCPAD